MDPVKFVERHGVVLEGGRGPRPNLAEAIAGGPIRGSWWEPSEGTRDFLGNAHSARFYRCACLPFAGREGDLHPSASLAGDNQVGACTGQKQIGSGT